MKNLENFLKDSINSVFREKLIGYKLLYQLKLYSARYNPNLEIFQPEIDRDGYDLIIHDSIELRRFQIKTILSSSTTSKWDIQKNLIRPKPHDVGPLGYEMSPNGSGVGGGFILVEAVVKNDDLELTSFYYTDAFILRAFELDLIKHKSFERQKTVKNTVINFQRIDKNPGNGKKDKDLKVQVTKSSMIKFNGLEDLLLLADLPGNKSQNWLSSMREYQKSGNLQIRDEIIQSLKKLISDTRFRIE